jgi:hypothetical protein
MYPENHGKKWSINETIQLMKEVKILTIDEIAKNHKRTNKAIFLKLIREAAKLADNDNNLDLYDLSIITTLKMKTILDGFEKINYTKFFKEKKEITDNDNDNDNDNYNDNDNDNDNDNYCKYTGIIIMSIMIVMFFGMDYIHPNNFYFQSFSLNDVIYT